MSDPIPDPKIHRQSPSIKHICNPLIIEGLKIGFPLVISFTCAGCAPEGKTYAAADEQKLTELIECAAYNNHVHGAAQNFTFTKA